MEVEVIEEFEKLTKNQREVLSKDINELAKSLIKDGHLTGVQQVTTWQHIRLEDEIYLYAELNLKLNPLTYKVDGKLLRIKRFNNRNDYFKSVYETNST